MNTTTFDTHMLIKSLKDQGMAENQAEVIVNIVRDAREIDKNGFATKHDIILVEQRIIIKIGAMLFTGIGFLAALQFFAK